VTDTAYGHIATKEDHVTNERQIGTNAKAVSDTEKAVRSYFSDIPVMIQIARCESTFRHTLSDGTVLHGQRDPADIGVMQINQRYHGENARELGLDLRDLHDNMEYARDLYLKQGTKPWTASAACWSPTIAMR
jgi:hypothetical protein